MPQDEISISADQTPSAFWVLRISGDAIVILASSWSQKHADGTINFYDKNSRLVAAVAQDRIVTIKLLTEGPIIWAAGQEKLPGEPLYVDKITDHPFTGTNLTGGDCARCGEAWERHSILPRSIDA